MGRAGIELSRNIGLKKNIRRLLFALLDIADALVTLLTLGYMTTDWRAWLLFSDWFDE